MRKKSRKPSMPKNFSASRKSRRPPISRRETHPAWLRRAPTDYRGRLRSHAGDFIEINAGSWCPPLWFGVRYWTYVV